MFVFPILCLIVVPFCYPPEEMILYAIFGEVFIAFLAWWMYVAPDVQPSEVNKQ